MTAASTANSGAAIPQSPAPEVKPLHHADYFSQIFQVPPFICGRQLKTLSIGRYRMMSRFKVAFAADDVRPATAGDLLMGVLICSMEIKEFSDFASHPSFRRKVEQWGRQFGFFEPVLFERTLNPRFFFGSMFHWMFKKLWPAEYDRQDIEYLTQETQKFQDYIKEGSTAPDYWDESPDSRASAAHWSQSIEVVLCGNLNWTAEMINEEPLGKALWDYFKFMENQGLVRLMSKDEAAEVNKTLTPEENAQADTAAAEMIAALARMKEANG